MHTAHTLRAAPLAALLLFASLGRVASAGIVEFDHIGSLPTPYTGNLNGLLMYDVTVLAHDWRRTGVRWEQSQTATLESASFVVFIANTSVDLAHMQDNVVIDLHLWNGYEESFALHPWEGDQVIASTDLPRSIVPWTTVGPTGTEFQTFKVTFDFTSLATPIMVDEDQEYVIAPVGTAGGQLRLSLSNVPGGGDLVDVAAAGSDSTFTTTPALIDTLPGSLPPQFGAIITVVPVPEPATWLLAAFGAGSVAVIVRRQPRRSTAHRVSDSISSRRGC
jgi:hypothetical protein